MTVGLQCPHLGCKHLYGSGSYIKVSCTGQATEIDLFCMVSPSQFDGCGKRNKHYDCLWPLFQGCTVVVKMPLPRNTTQLILNVHAWPSICIS